MNSLRDSVNYCALLLCALRYIKVIAECPFFYYGDILITNILLKKIQLFFTYPKYIYCTLIFFPVKFYK